MMDTPKLISFCKELKDTFDKLKQENTDLKKENQKLQDIKIIREKLVELKQSQETVVTQINSILDDMNTLIDTHEDDDDYDEDEEQHILFTYEGVNYLG
jgi:hypothetical protein